MNGTVAKREGCNIREEIAVYIAGAVIDHPEDPDLVMNTTPEVFETDEVGRMVLEQRIKEILQRDDTETKTKKALADVIEIYLNTDYVEHHHGLFWKLSFIEKINKAAARRNWNKKRKSASDLVTAQDELDKLFLEEKATIVKPENVDREEH